MKRVRIADGSTMLGNFDRGLEPMIYRIDADDVLVFVNDAWRSFARENAGPDEGDVIGTSLWDWIAGRDPTHFWVELLRRVREGATIDVPYRCDSPSLRRFLRMTITPSQGGGIEFISTLVRVEARDPVALLVPGPDDRTPVRSCSWCRRFDVSGWVEVEEAVVRLGVFDREPPPVTHSMCDRCAAEIMSAVRPRALA